MKLQSLASQAALEKYGRESRRPLFLDGMGPPIFVQDRIYTHRFDPKSGRRVPFAAALFVSIPPGDGPRLLAFHPKGHCLYSVQKQVSTVFLFHYDPDTGRY